MSRNSDFLQGSQYVPSGEHPSQRHRVPRAAKSPSKTTKVASKLASVKSKAAKLAASKAAWKTGGLMLGSAAFATISGTWRAGQSVQKHAIKETSGGITPAGIGVRGFLSGFSIPTAGYGAIQALSKKFMPSTAIGAGIVGIGAGIGAATGALFDAAMGPMNMKREARGKAPITFQSALGVAGAAATTIPTAVIAGGIRGAKAGVGAGFLTGASVLGVGLSASLTMANSAARSFRQYIQESVTGGEITGIEGTNIRGSFNNTRRDPTSSTNLVQALHKNRHKRVL